MDVPLPIPNKNTTHHRTNVT